MSKAPMIIVESLSLVEEWVTVKIDGSKIFN